MRRITIAVALAAGLLLGCKPQEPPTQVTGPEPVAKAQPTGATTTDDALSRTAPPALTPSPTPSPTPAAQPAGATKKYVVKERDTLFSIARDQLRDQHRVSEIKAMNPGITNWDVLKVGQEILIPAK